MSPLSFPGLTAAEITRRFDADGCIIYSRDDQILRVVDHWPLQPTLAAALEVPVGFGVTGLVARTGKTARLDEDVPRNSLLRRLLGLGEGASVARLCVPAPGVHAILAGVVSVHRGPDRPFSEDEQRQLEELAGMLGPRLHAGELWKRVHEHRSERDRLIEQAVSAQESERRRIAFDLHDGVSTALASMSFRIDAADLVVQRLGEDPATREARAELMAARELVDLAYHQTRAAISGLHSLVLDDLGLIAALESLAQSGNTDQTEVEFFVQPATDFSDVPDHAAATLYRIAQEALANAQRHAHASRIVLSLRRVGGSVLLGCTDDGVGFDPLERPRVEQSASGAPIDHVGLASIEERCALIEASLRIESQPGRGTTVLVELPLRE